MIVLEDIVDLEEAIEESMPDANWYVEDGGEDAYNSLQMANMFKAGALWMADRCANNKQPFVSQN